MTPIEAAASTSWNATRAPMSATWDELTACQPGSPGARCQDRHRAIVRATIAAIREPSEAMIHATEAAARAIYNADPQLGPNGPVPWDQQHTPLRAVCVAQARAAIEAIIDILLAEP
jgi:hypothetical protein